MMILPNWNWTLIAVAVSFHSVAILSTTFRLWYRWYTSLLWWDDAWAGLALGADVAFLVVSLLEQPVPQSIFPRFFVIGSWIVSFAYPILMWSARISILVSVVRVCRPEGAMRSVVLVVGASFGVMALVMTAVRLRGCILYGCLLTRGPLIIQTAMDCVADVLLSVLPLLFLRRVTLSSRRKILVSSAFLASMVINIVTVLEAVACLQVMTSGSVIFDHVKVACSMIVCNLLVIVTWVYRVLHKHEKGLEDSIPVIELTTVIDLAQSGSGQDTSMGWRPVVPSMKTKSSTWSFRGNRPGPEVSRPVTLTTSPAYVEGEESVTKLGLP